MSDPSPSGQQRVNEPTIDPFANVVNVPGRGGEPFARFIDLFRTLQDSVIVSNPPDGVWDEVAVQVQAAIDLLEPWAVPERQRPAGSRIDLPGRGNPMLVPFLWDEVTPERTRGRATFRSFHLGGNGAAHGGTLPLLFDEVLGRAVNTGFDHVARTAYLKVNYRKITPLNVELRIDGTVDRVEGRKRWASARLFHDETLIADAEGLFIELRPGQP
jgi:acyl-coenzyme A thioesterase PaaI-like protein